MTEQRDMYGVLARNEKRESQSQPTHRGECTIGGKDYIIAAWVRAGKSGKYVSLAFTPRDTKAFMSPHIREWKADIDAAQESTPYVACYFGGCPECGKNDGFLNVGRMHIFVCHTHKTGWIVGENLFSSWRDESEEIWEANIEKLKDYWQVEPLPSTEDALQDK